jgi:hypothetical protein
MQQLSTAANVPPYLTRYRKRDDSLEVFSPSNAEKDVVNDDYNYPCHSSSYTSVGEPLYDNLLCLGSV